MMLTTNRLLIRPYKKEDFKDLYDILKRPEVCHYLTHEPWDDSVAEEKFKERLQNNELEPGKMMNLAVVYNDKVIGDLFSMYTEMKDTVEIGYVISPDYSRQGFAAEGIERLLEYLFEEKNVHRVQANLDTRNLASKRLCERLGMRQEGHFIQDYWNKGQWTDSYMFGLLNSEFMKKRND